MNIKRDIYLNRLISSKHNSMIKVVMGKILNKLRIKGYSVDVGQVILNTKNSEDKSQRKHLEVDFMLKDGII
ncbi:MAG: hypothetical protein IJ681_02445 [Bacteroidales bacterium]|nr:hypothetical protein [Bacteroidales bacterium]